jgi:hypothetical protein
MFFVPTHFVVPMNPVKQLSVQNRYGLGVASLAIVLAYLGWGHFQATSGANLPPPTAGEALAAGCADQRCISVASDASSDTYTWRDSQGYDRTARLLKMTATQEGGIAMQFTYYVPNPANPGMGVQKREVNPAGGHPGFGYVVSHNLKGAAVEGCGLGEPGKVDTSAPVFMMKGQTSMPLVGDHHRIHEYRFNYPRSGSDGKCYQVPVIVDWSFYTGLDHPIFGITWDVAAAKAADGTPAAANVLNLIDSRAPYGSMSWGGDGTTLVQINRLNWADTHVFAAQGNNAPLHLNSPWTWNTPVRQSYQDGASAGDVMTPFVGLQLASQPVGFGLIATQMLNTKDAGGYHANLGLKARGATSQQVSPGCAEASQPNGPITPTVMPCEWQWSFQSVSYTSGYGTARAPGWQTDSFFSPHVSWGTVAGFVGQSSVLSTRGEQVMFSGYPRISYATYIELGGADTSGAGSASGSTFARALAEKSAAKALAQVTATVGTVQSSCPAGPGRTDAEACGNSGVNGVPAAPNGYQGSQAAWLVQAANNKFDVQLTHGNDVFAPTLLITGYTASKAPATLAFNGGASTLTAGRDYFASVDTGGKALWITFNRASLPITTGGNWTWRVATR